MELNFCPQCGCSLTKKTEGTYERKFCLQCKHFIYENPVPVVAGIILEQDKRILLVKRGVEPCIGKWTLPTGFIELHETPEQCVVREVFEETNLKCHTKSLFGVYQQKGWKYKSVVTIAYRLTIESGTLRAGDDASDARFFSYNELPDIPFISHCLIIKDLFQ
jgi:ADP-ribose pyrophosphatase YjhB (NUDIX family)